ncbi:zinc metallopeptidase RseP [Bremerella volcania]|uniref:Zinc metallopeptidase RseP n=1 Tax=Bremerella volcania TaxID=2527984 RepID=A0A518C2U9_9BACT|nr:PDZ domain-containing protein [Bremerella volcania]QDU73551.1 zinc metallopeptidase RseP [Bremerella volcania]
MKVRHWFMAAILATGVVAIPMMQVVTADEAAKEETKVEAKQEEPAAKKYWLGVQLAPTPEILKKHVERLKDGGAMVAGVAPESPAEKAGLKAGDHVLKVNDVTITSPEQMVDVVRDSDGKAMTVRVLRGLEIESVTVQPEEAPENMWSASPQFGAVPGIEMQPAHPGARLRFFGPGQMVPPQVRLQALDKDMPQNMMIRVEKKGDAPTTLHIERDGQKWSVTEDQIDQLPEDLQPVAKKYLTFGNTGNIIIGGQDVPFIELQEMLKDMGPQGLPGNADFQQRMQEEMKQMHEMIRKMHERMERIQVAPPAAEKPAENEV